MQVKKQNGDIVVFNPDNLKRSLKRSGATEAEVEKVYQFVTENMYEGIGTKELYQRAFNALKKIRNSFAARYSLKEALKELGPEGFYFEKWMAKIFQKEGRDAVTGQVLQGNAVTHEIDIVASKGQELLICECKFRNDEEAKISVTTPMYFLSRFNDLKPLTFTYFGRNLQPTRGYLITNAYFTSDSIAFASYYNINLISWDYPEHENLKSLTDRYGMYPVTSLTTLSKEQKHTLLSKNCLLVREIVDNPVLLDHFKFDTALKRIVLEEAAELCEAVEQQDSFTT